MGVINLTFVLWSPNWTFNCYRNELIFGVKTYTCLTPPPILHSLRWRSTMNWIIATLMDARVSPPVSGPLLQHLYLAPFPMYYHFSYVTTCDLEKSFTFDNNV